MTRNDEEIVRKIEEARIEEREKLAMWMISMTFATGHGDTTEDLLKELEWQIRQIREKQKKRDAEMIMKRYHSITVEEEGEGIFWARDIPLIISKYILNQEVRNE